MKADQAVTGVAPEPSAEPPVTAGPPAPAAQPGWSTVPRVNLLPPEILAARRFRHLQLGLAAGLVAVAAVCGAATVWADGGVSSAQADLDATRADGVRLAQQQARYAEVPKALAELDTVRAVREEALGTDVAWYTFLSDLALQTPPDTSLVSVTISMTGRSTAAPSTVPLAPSGLGSVRVTGQARRYVDVAAWLDAVNEVHGLAGSSFETAGIAATGSSGSDTVASDGGSGPGGSAQKVTFNGTAVVVPAALSHRFDRKAG